MADDEFRRQILDAFGVTQEEIDALDATSFGQAEIAARREREEFAAALPDRIAAVEAEIQGRLPEGLTVRFGA